jgi:hypothetical protein
MLEQWWRSGHSQSRKIKICDNLRGKAAAFISGQIAVRFT